MTAGDFESATSPTVIDRRYSTERLIPTWRRGSGFSVQFQMSLALTKLLYLGMRTLSLQKEDLSCIVATNYG